MSRDWAHFQSLYIKHTFVCDYTDKKHLNRTQQIVHIKLYTVKATRAPPLTEGQKPCTLLSLSLLILPLSSRNKSDISIKNTIYISSIIRLSDGPSIDWDSDGIVSWKMVLRILRTTSGSSHCYHDSIHCQELPLLLSTWDWVSSDQVRQPAKRQLMR